MPLVRDPFDISPVDIRNADARGRDVCDATARSATLMDASHGTALVEAAEVGYPALRTEAVAVRTTTRSPVADQALTTTS